MKYLAVLLMMGAVTLNGVNSENITLVEKPTDTFVSCGETGILKCAFSALVSKCYWSRNDIIIEIKDRYKFIGNSDDGNCSIQITNSNIDQDHGKWFCGNEHKSSLNGEKSQDAMYNVTCSGSEPNNIKNDSNSEDLFNSTASITADDHPTERPQQDSNPEREETTMESKSNYQQATDEIVQVQQPAATNESAPNTNVTPIIGDTSKNNGDNITDSFPPVSSTGKNRGEKDISKPSEQIVSGPTDKKGNLKNSDTFEKATDTASLSSGAIFGIVLLCIVIVAGSGLLYHSYKRQKWCFEATSYEVREDHNNGGRSEDEDGFFFESVPAPCSAVNSPQPTLALPKDQKTDDKNGSQSSVKQLE